jgi:hypothetical protein
MTRSRARTVALVVGAVATAVALTTGTGACDTRYPDDVTGVVVEKTERATDDSHNPSLVIDPDEWVEGDWVRVWLKEMYWETYEVGDSYP